MRWILCLLKLSLCYGYVVSTLGGGRKYMHCEVFLYLKTALWILFYEEFRMKRNIKYCRYCRNINRVTRTASHRLRQRLLRSGLTATPQQPAVRKSERWRFRQPAATTRIRHIQRNSPGLLQEHMMYIWCSQQALPEPTGSSSPVSMLTTTRRWNPSTLTVRQ